MENSFQRNQSSPGTYQSTLSILYPITKTVDEFKHFKQIENLICTAKKAKLISTEWTLHGLVCVGE